MMQTKSLVTLAGAALGLCTVALAQSADETRAAQAELLSDASARTSLLQDRSKPAVVVGGFTQFQYNINVRDDDFTSVDGIGDMDNTIGFRFARTKVNFKAAITDEWSVFVQAVQGPLANFSLDDIYGQYKGDTGFWVRFGQSKLPFLGEERVSDTGQLASQRSIINDNYTAGRSQGVWIGYDAEQWRFIGAFSDGANQVNSEFDTESADFALTARGEWQWAGAGWDRFDDFTSFRGQEFAGKVGFAGHYEDGGETNGTTDQSIWGLTGDVQVEGNGWNAFGAVVYTNFEPFVGDDISNLGVVLQGGIFVTEDWELFGRGVANMIQDAPAPEPEDFFAITAGANYYLIPESHAVKATFELTYFLDPTFENDGRVNMGAPNYNHSLLPSGEDGQFVIRGQLQFVF